MPEAPEVTHLSGYINEHVAGRTLTDARILGGRYAKHGPPEQFREFSRALPLRLESVSKKGKLIVFHFEKGWYMLSRLGLMGWWYVPGDEPKWQKPAPRFELKFRGAVLEYTDTLSYGTLRFTNQAAVVEAELARLAPDIFQEATTWAVVKPRVAKTGKQHLLQDVLVDQGAIVSGIGNYLKAEVLYDARISPMRAVGDVTEADWKQILRSAKKVCRRMLKAAGDPEKYKKGMRIFWKPEDPLGNPVRKDMTKTGRTTYWVPALQS